MLNPRPVRSLVLALAGTLALATACGSAATNDSRVRDGTTTLTTSAAPTTATSAPTTAAPTATTLAPTTSTTTRTLSNDNTYTNSDGNTVHSPAYPSDGQAPAGATAQCRDGTYSFSQHHRGTCSHHGGVARWL